MRFSAETKKKLKHYVYGLVDPRSGELFYIGKASKNDRPSQHFKANKDESVKAKCIEEIRSRDLEPSIDILRFGLESSDIAHEVESAIIDAIGLENLTNQIRGKKVKHGRFTAEYLEQIFGSTPIDVNTVTSSCMIFYIHKTYSSTMTEQQIYDCTRQFWYEVSKDNRENLNADVALSVVDGVVIRAYQIIQWFEGGSTLSTRNFNGADDKWEFVGNRIINHPLLDKLLVDSDGVPLEGNQRGYRYLPIRT